MRTRKLDPKEIRVLGVLMEKEQTTPDQYPLTLNAVIAGCNQKSNRDPVTDLSETEVVEALDRLRHDALTWRSSGARTERWEHCLDRRWGLRRPSKAIMCLLLLRGPQTVGELKTRSERMHRFESLAEVERVLSHLAEGFDALVAQLPRRPGQRETRWTHKVAVAGEEAPTLEGPAPEPLVSMDDAAYDPSPASGPSPLARLDALEARVEELQDELRSLRIRLGDLTQDGAG